MFPNEANAELNVGRSLKLFVSLKCLNSLPPHLHMCREMVGPTTTRCGSPPDIRPAFLHGHRLQSQTEDGTQSNGAASSSAPRTNKPSDKQKVPKGVPLQNQERGLTGLKNSYFSITSRIFLFSTFSKGLLLPLHDIWHLFCSVNSDYICVWLQVFCNTHCSCNRLFMKHFYQR